mmetsp:Transcript_5984/g.10979  ORF Transcript_5984/g.10979 Transcript_5984/m.10979 type:complete len:354 (-) Transcript_5984:187-1248(-)
MADMRERRTGQHTKQSGDNDNAAGSEAERRARATEGSGRCGPSKRTARAIAKKTPSRPTGLAKVETVSVHLAPVPPFTRAKSWKAIHEELGQTSDVLMECKVLNIQMYAPTTPTSPFSLMMTIVDCRNVAMVIPASDGMFSRLLGIGSASVGGIMSSSDHTADQKTMQRNMQAWLNLSICCHIKVSVKASHRLYTAVGVYRMEGGAPQKDKKQVNQTKPKPQRRQKNKANRTAAAAEPTVRETKDRKKKQKKSDSQNVRRKTNNNNQQTRPNPQAGERSANINSKNNNVNSKNNKKLPPPAKSSKWKPVKMDGPAEKEKKIGSNSSSDVTKKPTHNKNNGNKSSRRWVAKNKQ